MNNEGWALILSNRCMQKNCKPTPDHHPKMLHQHNSHDPPMQVLKIQIKAKGNETSFTRMQNKFNFYEPSAMSENDGFDLKSAAPRSSVNNCTESQKKVELPERELIPDTSGYTDYLDWQPILDDVPDFDNVPIMESIPCMENMPDYGDLVPIDDDQPVYDYSEYEQFAG